jgi:uncharacterized protein YdaU (DUF1376 family)
MSLPYMTLYVGDYLADTRHFSADQHGAYLLLLMSMWRAGGHIPGDERSLAKLAGMSLKQWRTRGAPVEALLDRDGDTITQRRLLSELQRANVNYGKKVAAGRASAEAKALKTKQAGATDVDVVLEHTCQQTADNHNHNQNQNHKKEDLASATPPPSKPKAVRGTRWPDGQKVPEDWIEEVRDRMRAKSLPLPDFNLEAERFASYWPSQPGQRGVKTNWAQTFYNWCLNARGNGRGVDRDNGYSAMLAGARRAAAIGREREGMGSGQSDPLLRLASPGKPRNAA